MADPVSLIIKAIKVKIALNRLSRLKENAVREHMGLPPKKNWFEECYTGFMQSLRTACCEIFTPCCTFSWLKPKIPDNPCKRVFYLGTYENGVFRNCLGFLFGVFVTICIYIVMVLQLNFRPVVASVSCSVVGVFMTFSLAFSSQARMTILLMLPQFFTSRGRVFLLMYAVMLVMTHPVLNFNRNVLVMSDSATCGQELAFNQTRQLVESAVSPIAGIMGSIKTLFDALKNFANTVRKAFMALHKAINEIYGAMQNILYWLKNITTLCNRLMDEPYQKCIKAFMDAFNNCVRALLLFAFLCVVVMVFMWVCLICKALDLLCIALAHVKKLIQEKIQIPINRAIYDVYTMFYFNVTVDYHYSFHTKQSKSYSQVRKDILEEVKERLGGFTSLLSNVSTLLMITILLVFIRSMIYRNKYLTNERFDNYYLTYKVLEVDKRRKKMKKESIFPLKSKEKSKYISTISLRMVKKEKQKLAKGILVLFLAACHAGFYLISDYGLWWLLTMMRKHLMIKTDKTVPPHLKMHVQGKGAMADMYRALVAMFDPLASLELEVDTEQCLPDPFEPQWKVYEEIGMIFGLCLFLVIFESYGLRLRHVICGIYHPKREHERGVWLYNHILKCRGGFLKYERRNMRRQYMTQTASEKGSFRGKLAARYNICRKLLKWLGWEQKACLSCGREGKKEDMENFYHCAQGDCKAVYCFDCFHDLNNMCTVCMNPIDYGDVSDLSEERDSSEDEEEYLIKKEKAKEARRARDEALERKRAENTDSMVIQRLMGAKALKLPEQKSRKSSVDQSGSGTGSAKDTSRISNLSNKTKHSEEDIIDMEESLRGLSNMKSSVIFKSDDEADVESPRGSSNIKSSIIFKSDNDADVESPRGLSNIKSSIIFKSDDEVDVESPRGLSNIKSSIIFKSDDEVDVESPRGLSNIKSSIIFKSDDEVDVESPRGLSNIKSSIIFESDDDADVESSVWKKSNHDTVIDIDSEDSYSDDIIERRK